MSPEGRNLPPVAQKTTINFSMISSQIMAPICATFTFLTSAPIATPISAITAPEMIEARIKFTNIARPVLA